MTNLVLTFHNIQDGAWFEQTLHLIGRFYTYGTLDQLYARLSGEKKSLNRMCFLTFDDGERSVYDVIFPILQRLSIPAAMFVSPLNIREGGAFWFQRMRQLQFQEIETLKNLPLADICKHIDVLDPSGATNGDLNIDIPMFEVLRKSGLVTFGAHTQHHPVLSNESDDTSHKEIHDSIMDLERLLGTRVRYFAYPNGGKNDFSNREINTLKQCGIDMAFSTIPGYATDQDMYAVRRIGLTCGNSMHIVLKLLFPQMFVKIRKWRDCLRGRTLYEQLHAVENSSAGDKKRITENGMFFVAEYANISAESVELYNS